MAERRAHSWLGGSGADRWLHCPGSFKLIQEAYDKGLIDGDGGTDYAAQGTAAHKLAEACLNSRKDAWEFVGQDFNGVMVVPDTEAVSLVDPNVVQEYVDYVRSLAARADWSAVEVAIGQTYRPNEYFYGYADFVAFVPPGAGHADDGLHVVDHKHGAGIGVPAVNNPQLMYYAWGVLNEIPLHTPPLMPVHLTIFQPRYKRGDASEENTWSTTVGDLTKWATEVLLPGMQKAIQSQNPREELAIGSWCRFCPLMREGLCPAVNQAVEDVAAMADKEKVENMTPEQVDLYYQKALVAKMAIRLIEKKAETLLMAGGEMKFAKLVHKRANRAWKEGAEEKLADWLGEEAFAPRVYLTPPAVEKLSSKGKEFVSEYAYTPQNPGYRVAATDAPGKPVDIRKEMDKTFGHYQDAAKPAGVAFDPSQF